MKNNDIGKEIGILHNHIKRYFEASHATEGVTGMQGFILHYLLGAGREIYPKDIEEEFCIRRATVSRYLIAMETNGLIERAPIANDKRVRRIVLTEKAKKMNESVQADIKSLEAKLTNGLTEKDKAEFLRLASIIEKSMNE